eukprot:403364423
MEKQNISNSLRIEKVKFEEIKGGSSTKQNKYRTEKFLKGGAFGDVYLASRRQQVAIKKFKQLPDEKDLVELSIMRAIKSKHLCRLEDAFLTDQNEFVIVQEYAEHGDLQNYCDNVLQGNIEESQALLWFAQTALGLKELHKRNIMHRDIKPDNILVFSEKDVRLGDYGQAKIVESTLKGYQTTTGTLKFMSPEMLNEQNYDYSTDIYSLGFSFIILLTKVAPDLENIVNNSWGVSEQVISQQFQQLLKAMICYDRKKRPNIDIVLSHPLISEFEFVKEYYQQEGSTYLKNSNIIQGYDKPQFNQFESELEQHIKTLMDYQDYLGSNNLNEIEFSQRQQNFHDQLIRKTSKIEKLIDKITQGKVKINREASNKNANDDRDFISLPYQEDGNQQNVKGFKGNKQAMKKIVDNLKFKPKLANLFSNYIKQEVEKDDNSMLRSAIPNFDSLSFHQVFNSYENGFTAREFHKSCDSKKPTLIFIQSDLGQVFGGYTEQEWQPSGSGLEHISDSNAFLFQMNKRTIHGVRKGKPHQIGRSLNKICIFGDNTESDITICNNCDIEVESSSNLGHSFELPKDQKVNPQTYLAGSYKFKVTNIAVFHLTQ